MEFKGRRPKNLIENFIFPSRYDWWSSSSSSYIDSIAVHRSLLNSRFGTNAQNISTSLSQCISLYLSLSFFHTYLNAYLSNYLYTYSLSLSLYVLWFYVSFSLCPCHRLSSSLCVTFTTSMNVFQLIYS